MSTRKSIPSDLKPVYVINFHDITSRARKYRRYRLESGPAAVTISGVTHQLWRDAFWTFEEAEAKREQMLLMGIDRRQKEKERLIGEIYDYEIAVARLINERNKRAERAADE